MVSIASSSPTQCLMMVQVMLVLLMSSCIPRGANSEVLEGRHHNLIRGVRIQQQQQQEITRQLVETTPKNSDEPPRTFSSYEYQFDVDVDASTTATPTTGTDEKALNSEPTYAPTNVIIYSDEGVFLPAEAVRQKEQKEDDLIDDEEDTLEPTVQNDEATAETEEQAVENALQDEEDVDEQQQQEQEETPTPDPLVEDEADNFLPAPEEDESTEAAVKSDYYYVDLRPFSVFVETTQDLSMDLGIPLYLLLEMGETLGNLVDVKISNLTIHMGVIYNNHGHQHDDNNQHHAVRARNLQDSDSVPDHLHWNQLFFQGKAEFEDSVVYPTLTVQNVQSLVLSNEAGLQEFWDTQGMGETYQHLELKNITMLPFPTVETTTVSPTSSPTVVEEEQTQPSESTQAPTVLQTEIVEYPDAETERSSNVWVMVPLVVIFLMVCFCIIGLCGRLQYLSSRAQERYNEKYGLDYNVYDKDIGREIFKEEYLMSEHDGHDFSHNSFSHNSGGLSDSLRSIEGFLSRPISSIKSARRSSNAKIKNPTNDEISTEEEEEDTTQGSPVGGGEEVRSVTPNNSQTRHNGSFMPAMPTPALQGSSRSIEAPPTEERNGQETLTDDDEEDSQPPEEFVDEFSDNEGLEPPAVSRETVSMAPIAPSEFIPVVKSIPVKRAEPRQKPIPDNRATTENIPVQSIPNKRAPPESIPVQSIPNNRAPSENSIPIPNKRAEVGEANLLDLPDFTAPPRAAPMSPRMEQSKPEFENMDHVHSTPTKDNRTNVVDSVPIVAIESSARSTGSFSSSSFKRRGSKGDMGNPSLKKSNSRGSFRSQGSYSTLGEEKGVMGNSSGRDRSTRSTRSIRSHESASSLGSFYSCQGDLV